MQIYCVTGGTGLIASHLIKGLLLGGHVVRTTVRDPDDLQKVGWLCDLEGAKERLLLFKADLLVKGSFDEAINGADGVFHIASPVFISDDDNIQETMINPCIKGTNNVLKSCSKSSSVKRVVLTSSCSSIRYHENATAASPINESHWSDPEYCAKYNLWYAYAKTMGEMEAWKLSKDLGLDLVVVNPSFVVGPSISPRPTSTIRFILSIIRASGRLICSSSVMHISEIMEMLKEMCPSYTIANKFKDREGDDFPHSMDSSKIMRLGISRFKSLPQMLEDCIKSFQEKGLLRGEDEIPIG